MPSWRGATGGLTNLMETGVEIARYRKMERTPLCIRARVSGLSGFSRVGWEPGRPASTLSRFSGFPWRAHQIGEHGLPCLFLLGALGKLGMDLRRDIPRAADGSAVGGL